MTIMLGDCKPMHARISERQCNVNRHGGHILCEGCAGLVGSGAAAITPQEEKLMAKHRCSKKNCTRAVPNEGEMCWQHKGLENQAEAGLVKMTDHTANLPITLADIERASDEFQEEVIQREAATALGHAHDLNSPLSTEEMAQIRGESGLEPAPDKKPTGLSALYRRLSPPPEPEGLLIPFSKEEVIALIESSVTQEHIRAFIVMGLEGKLVMIDDTDPLAMSRVHAAV